jgi:DNA-binding transcriptional LysR family regulator
MDVQICTDPAMLDWDDLRFFLAVARHRTLAAAAKRLHVTQSTVSRRLASLQAGMGVRLLHRLADGYALTLAGETIRAHVERVEAEALSVERAVARQDVRLEGLVRVSGSQLVTSYLLAPSFAALHSRHRDILIEALPELSSEPLSTHEADIAIRLRRFDHHDLLVRNIGAIAFGLYGSMAYLARQGEPDLGSGCYGHQLITLLDDRDLSGQADWLSEHAGCAHVVLKADSYETQHWAVYCGGGLAILPRFRADAEPALQRIKVVTPIPSAEIWLGVHRENRMVPRVRTVLDCIAETVRNRAASLNPADPTGVIATLSVARGAETR